MFNFLEDVKLKKQQEKKRKKIYGEELRLQIEQNKKKKLEEKIKSRQESIRNLQLFQNPPLINYNTLSNYDKYQDNFNNNYQYMKTSIDNSLFNYQFNNNFLTLSNKKNSFNNNNYNSMIINNDLQKNFNNLYQNTDFNLFRNNNNNFKRYYNNNYNDNSKNNNMSNNMSNGSNNFIENGIFIMKKSPSSFLNNRPSLNNNNLLSQNNNSLFSQKNDLLNNNNDNSSIINNNDNTISNNYLNNFNNNALMAEINLQFLFREFVEQQIKTINDYENNIEDIFFQQYKTKNNNSINTLLENEKNQAIQAIKNEQIKLKNKLGFFPMENSYNYKIEQLFKKILNKKIVTYSSINEMDNLLKNIIDRQNDQIELLKYKSKYEDENENENIQDIIPNFQKFNLNSQKTLRGYSKLVKINDNDNIQENIENINNDNAKDETNFLESWREQLGKEIHEDKIDNIKLTKNENLIHNNNELEFSNNNININGNIKAYPVNQNFKNVQNRNIITKKNNENYNDFNPDKKFSLFLPNRNIIKYDKRNKSAKNLFCADKISSHNLNIYKKEYTFPKNNEINQEKEYNIQEIKNNINLQNNLSKKYNRNNKNSFSFKKTDSSFMKNAKKGLYFSQSNKFFKNYDNYIVLKKDENIENKNNNEEQLEKYSDPKITDKLKSLNTSSNSEISHN